LPQLDIAKIAKIANIAKIAKGSGHQAALL
jgi:hypothetical protein